MNVFKNASKPECLCWKIYGTASLNSEPRHQKPESNLAIQKAKEALATRATTDVNGRKVGQVPHPNRPAEEGEHQTDATPSNLREDGSATLSESVEERVVLEGEHQTDATPRDLREVSRATSSKIVEQGPADEGEHQTDATPSNLIEDGGAPSSQSIEKRAVVESEHQTDATPRDLREVSRATSSKIVEQGAVDEGEHPTDAAPSNLREAGDMPRHHNVLKRSGKFEGRITRTIVMCWILVLINGLLIGYTNGILVAVLNVDDFLWDMFPSLREGNQHAHVNNKCKYMDHKQQFLSSSMSLISLPSFLASAFLCFKYERKSMIYLALLPFVIGIAMNAVASGKLMVLAGRAMLSIGVGFYSQVIPVLIDELTHSAAQDPLFIGFQAVNYVGILGSSVTAYFFNNMHDLGWRYAIIVMIVPWLILVGISYFIPETPIYLLSSGSVEEGEATLMKIRGLPNVNAELQKLEATIVSFRNFRAAFLEVWRLSSRPTLYILLVTQILQQVTGATAIVYFGSLVFTSLGFSDEASLISSTSSVVSINAILLSGVGSDGLVPRAMAIGIDVLCALYSFNFALVSSPLGWLGETYPLVVRILGVVPPTSSNFALSLIIAQLSQVIMCLLQIWIFIISAILNAIGALTIYFFIPETTWILPDLMPERVWRRHWLWKLYFPNRNRDDPPADKEDGKICDSIDNLRRKCSKKITEASFGGEASVDGREVSDATSKEFEALWNSGEIIEKEGEDPVEDGVVVKPHTSLVGISRDARKLTWTFRGQMSPLRQEELESSGLNATWGPELQRRAVVEGEHQTDATPRDLREVSRATSLEIVELGATDEGEHPTDAAPSNLREAGDAPSSQRVKEGKFEGRITRTIVMCWILVLTNGLLIGYTNGILVAVLNMDDFLWDMFPSLREGNQHAHVNNKCKYMDHKQ
ncbi:hypothetical protein LguiA_022308 [Lonicera macranthoides]